MSRTSGDEEIETFLKAHRPIANGASFAPGETFGEWRVAAFLGRGGSGEVYRVVHTELGTSAALKVYIPRTGEAAARDASARARFKREMKFLAGNTHPFFPRFFNLGEHGGRPWYVMELLEPIVLPATDRAVARFMLTVIEGVGKLHALGLVHRDIKPGNIMQRKSDDGKPPEPVLIDMGLVKDVDEVRGHFGDSLSIVDGKAVAVGTPRYAAPEQLSGGEVTQTADIYALGMLANDCFEGKPPYGWARIIKRATAAIPEHRYATVAGFAKAIKLHRIVRYVFFSALFGLAAIGCYTVGQFVLLPRSLEQIGYEVVTNIVNRYESERKVNPEFIKRFRFRGSSTNSVNPFISKWVTETNSVSAVIVHLDGKTQKFDKPIRLKKKEYWIYGPGCLDADISGPTGAVVRLKDCLVLNQTKDLYPTNGVHYMLFGGVYLNFVNIKKDPAPYPSARSYKFISMCDTPNLIRFGGPLTIREAREEEIKAHPEVYSPTMKAN